MVDNVRITIHKYDFSLKETSPFERIYYYGKDRMSYAFRMSKEDVSSMIPQTVMESYLRLYCTSADKLQTVKNLLGEIPTENIGMVKISPKAKTRFKDPLLPSPKRRKM